MALCVRCSNYLFIYYYFSRKKKNTLFSSSCTDAWIFNCLVGLAVVYMIANHGSGHESVIEWVLSNRPKGLSPIPRRTRTVVGLVPDLPLIVLESRPMDFWSKVTGDRERTTTAGLHRDSPPWLKSTRSIILFFCKYFSMSVVLLRCGFLKKGDVIQFGPISHMQVAHYLTLSTCNHKLYLFT